MIQSMTTMNMKMMSMNLDDDYDDEEDDDDDEYLRRTSFVVGKLLPD